MEMLPKTKLFQAQGVITIKVEGKDIREAQREVRRINEVLRKALPTGVTYMPMLTNYTTPAVKQI